MPTPKALLFDLGGVLIEIDFARTLHFWSEISGVDSLTLKKRFSMDADYRAHERGEVAAAAYAERLQRRLGIELGEHEFLQGWNLLLCDEVAGAAALLQQLQGECPLYLFSNSNPTHKACWTGRYAELLTPFEALFVSSDMGLRKPDAAAFNWVLQSIGCSAEEVLFFDDTAENINAARALGMDATLVSGIESVTQRLKAAALLQ